MNGRRYLVVDDNRAYADNLAEILREEGAHVEVAADGSAALERLAAARFDAVVTDMRMPGMDGAELAGRVRALDPQVPIVALTADVPDASVEAARRSGLLAVLPKLEVLPRLLRILSSARRGVVVIVGDPALAGKLAEALAAHGLTTVMPKSLAELEQLALKPFAALLPQATPGEALDRVRARFPGVRAVELPGPGEGPDRQRLVRETVERVEQLYPSGGQP